MTTKPVAKEFLFTAAFWRFAWERAVTTIGEAVLASLGINGADKASQGLDVLNIDPVHIISIGLGAGIVSLGFSVRAYQKRK
jgi:hypothetical protein